MRAYWNAFAAWCLAPPAIADTAAPRSLRVKLIEWTRRYLPLEIIATITALAGGLLTAFFTSNAIAIAYGGAMGENVGYYGLAFAREMRTRAALDAAEGSAPEPTLSRAWHVVKNLVWEFGMAELIDSFVSRPFWMYTATALIGSLEAGIVAGKFIADVFFYAIAIVFYEARKEARKTAR
jgi:hypothetical protein